MTTINGHLEKEHLCCPPYNSINGKFINDAGLCIKNNDLTKLRGLVTCQVSLPWRRAYQMVYRYRELDIFKPFLKVIDFSTICLEHTNWICSYLSLAPVIEGLLYRWHEEEPLFEWGKEGKIKYFIRQKIDQQIRSSLNKDQHYDSWLLTFCDYISDVLNNVFYNSEDNERTSNTHFNRHVVLHMKQDPEYFNEPINTCRLLLIMDVIAELYFRTNYDKYPKLHGVFDLDFNKDLFNKYWKFYLACSESSLITGNHECYLTNTFYKEKS